MRTISFDLEKSDTSGKHKFMSRLRNELIKYDYKEVSPEEESDIHLYTRKYSKNAKYNIYRIDGICVNESLNDDKKDCKSLNLNISDKIYCSSGVVFQNIFCKKAVDKIIKETYSNYTCIVNGADPEEFNVDPLKRDNPYFMALCKWRPHKRLKEIVEGFLRSDIKDTDLLIYGDADYIIDHPRVVYMGWKKQNELSAAINGSIATVHLAWLDWCPNSVVESVVAGKQVIYTNSGGTKYIVKDRGHIVNDSSWKYEFHDLYNPPSIDMDEVANAYIKAKNEPIKNFKSDDLHISTVALQYYNFFEKIIESNDKDEKQRQDKTTIRLLDRKWKTKENKIKKDILDIKDKIKNLKGHSDEKNKLLTDLKKLKRNIINKKLEYNIQRNRLRTKE